MATFVRCIVDIDYFTNGKLYEYTYTDRDGDHWVVADDDGHEMFMYPEECEFYEEKE